MTYLNLTTDKLQIISSAAAAIDVHISWVDLLAGAVTPGRTNTAIASATTTDVVAAPASSTTRSVKFFSARNKDASLSGDVTVQFNQNGTLVELHKVTLAPGELLTFTEGVGWFKYANSAKLDKMVYVTADSVHATAATLAAVTGLSVPVLSGHTYIFEAGLIHIGNATTTGAQFAVGGVAMTELSVGEIGVTLNSATVPTFGAGSATAVDTVIVSETTGAATNALAYVTGYFKPSADGTFQIKATSEVTVAAGLTVKKGSWLRVRETDN